MHTIGSAFRSASIHSDNVSASVRWASVGIGSGTMDLAVIDDGPSTFGQRSGRPLCGLLSLALAD